VSTLTLNPFGPANMKRALLLIALFPLTARWYETTAPDLSGEWRGGVIMGVLTDAKQPGCASFDYLERIVLLNPVPGNQTQVRGLWKRHYTSFWINAQGGNCRWPSGPPQASSYESTLVYLVDGTLTPSTQTLQMRTKYKGCSGSACDQLPPEVRQSLDQTLQIRGESLVDTSVEGQQSVVLFRTADAVEMEISAKKAAADYNKLIDTGQSELLVRNDLSSFASSSGPQILDILQRLRQTVGRVVLRTSASQIYASVWASQPKKTAKLILLIQIAQASDNRQGLEVMALRQEEGIWKIDFLAFD
jgi:hypothetical protein